MCLCEEILMALVFLLITSSDHRVCFWNIGLAMTFPMHQDIEITC